MAKSFWDSVNRNGPGGCWLWTGSVSAKGGHGRVKGPDGRTTTAHRIAYQEMVGKIPNEMVLSHSCDNPRCVNPAHLRAVTQKENVREMIKRGRGVFQRKYGQKSTEVRNRTRSVDERPKPSIPPGVRTSGGAVMSVIGAPGAGKSSVACVAISSAVSARVFKIDDYRDKWVDNDTSWSALASDVLECASPCVVESSGLSRWLNEIARVCNSNGRPFSTLILSAPISVIQERIKDRPSTTIAGISYTIDEIVRDCLELLPDRYPGASIVDTTDRAEAISLCDKWARGVNSQFSGSGVN